MKKKVLVLTVVAALSLSVNGLAAPAQRSAPDAAPGQALTVAHYGYSEPRTTLADVDRIVVETMREWSVPGLALGIVADGRIIHSMGYGSRNVERRLPVTPDTLFAIASLTKAVTSTTLATLVDDGRLDWDRPVIGYDPDFRLSDAEITSVLTARDLITHQSGFPRHDFVWFGTQLSRDELINRLQFLEPSLPPRAGWQYQNLMFMAAGHVAEQITGESWESLVNERIFEPLAMDRATFSLDELEQRVDFAFPYAEGASGVRRVPFRTMEPIGPAGSIYASVDEMTRFVAMHLADGDYRGTQVVSVEEIREIRSPQVELPATLGAPLVPTGAYGLGVAISEFAGQPMVHHEGAVDGFSALMSFLPGAGLGVVVLTNYSGDNPVPWILTRSIYDRLLEVTPTDWAAVARDAVVHIDPIERDIRQTTSPIGSWRAGSYEYMPVDFAGVYEHPAYGELAIMIDDDDLKMQFHGLRFDLEYYDGARYVVSEGGLSGLPLTFFGNALHRIDRVAIPWEPAVSDIVFVRRTTAGSSADKGR